MEETPTIKNVLEGGGDYPLGDALTAFFALSEEDQSRLLALQPSAVQVATIAGAGGGLSDSAALVERLVQQEGCLVPPGQEQNAALFLRILDANAFQCTPNCDLQPGHVP